MGDVTKVQEGCRTLRLSKVEMKIITAMVQSEGIPVTDLPKEKRSNGGGASGEISLPLRTIHRFYHTNGVAGVEVCLISLAEVLAAQGPELNQREWAQHVDAVVDLFDAYFNRFDEVIAPPSLINGRELMQELGIPPGARVGMFLSEISEAQACGEVTNRSQAIELARKLYGLHK